MRGQEGRTQTASELRFGRKGSAAGRRAARRRPHRAPSQAAPTGSTSDGDGSLVVVDYKSGSATKFKGLSQDDPDLQGSKLQLPVYALAAQAAASAPTQARAEYWFIGAKDRGQRVGYDVTPQSSSAYRAVLTTIADGIAGGVFPANAPEGPGLEQLGRLRLLRPRRPRRQGTARAVPDQEVRRGACQLPRPDRADRR